MTDVTDLFSKAPFTKALSTLYLIIFLKKINAIEVYLTSTEGQISKLTRKYKPDSETIFQKILKTYPGVVPTHAAVAIWKNLNGIFCIILQKKWKKCNLEQIVQIFPIMQFETHKAICNV